MKPLVLDCSITMSWCFEDEASALSDLILHLLADREALVPSHWPLETANVLLVAERRKRLTRAQSSRFISILSTLPISVDIESQDMALSNTLALARDHKLSAYDAAYLELAIRQGASLATQDKLLRKAAEKIGIELITHK